MRLVGISACQCRKPTSLDQAHWHTAEDAVTTNLLLKTHCRMEMALHIQAFGDGSGLVCMIRSGTPYIDLRKRNHIRPTSGDDSGNATSRQFAVEPNTDMDIVGEIAKT